jgi:hypothetical protein
MVLSSAFLGSAARLRRRRCARPERPSGRGLVSRPVPNPHWWLARWFGGSSEDGEHPDKPGGEQPLGIGTCASHQVRSVLPWSGAQGVLGAGSNGGAALPASPMTGRSREPNRRSWTSLDKGRGPQAGPATTRRPCLFPGAACGATGPAAQPPSASCGPGSSSGRPRSGLQQRGVDKASAHRRADAEPAGGGVVGVGRRYGLAVGPAEHGDPGAVAQVSQGRGVDVGLVRRGRHRSWSRCRSWRRSMGHPRPRRVLRWRCPP